MVAAAAYRSGETLTSEYDGVTHDYTRKRGIVHTEILLPAHAPREYLDRSVLWNAVEKIEKNKNSQLSREIELALPAELTLEQNRSLVREYVNRHFISAGMCADICIHDKNDGNPHAHILLTMRPIEHNGSWGVKCHKVNGQKIPTVDWNEQSKAEEWRAAWAKSVNALLESQGLSDRVDHRSYARQGIDQIPTVHMGVSSTQMERRGIATERGNRNREISKTNLELRRLNARLKRLQSWSADKAPDLYSVLQGILNNPERQGQYQKVADLKTAAKLLMFLQSNHISDVRQLSEKVTEMRLQFESVSKKLKATERRLSTLGEHIKQGEVYQRHKALYRQYQEQHPKKKEAFYQKHSTEIILFESAKKYLDAHLNGHTLPLNVWKSEAAALAAKKDELYRDYYRLKDEVREVEIVKRTAERLETQERGENASKSTQDHSFTI